MKGRLIALPLFVVLYGACTAPVGSGLRVPSDAAATCETHCRDIGLELTAVAIMASNVGCVCQRSKAPAAVADRPGSISAGMATIALQQQEAQRRQAQPSQQQK